MSGQEPASKPGCATTQCDARLTCSEGAGVVRLFLGPGGIGGLGGGGGMCAGLSECWDLWLPRLAWPLPAVGWRAWPHNASCAMEYGWAGRAVLGGWTHGGWGGGGRGGEGRGRQAARALCDVWCWRVGSALCQLERAVSGDTPFPSLSCVLLWVGVGYVAGAGADGGCERACSGPKE
eukprot:COSAG02_NODE_2820_length_7966_cov_1.744757_1_plen_178_part_00